MKFWKKALCLVLTLALAAALCGCGAFTPRMVMSMQKLTKLESLHTDTTVTADVTLTLLDQELPLTMEVRVAGDHQRTPAANAFDVKFTVLDTEQHVLLCTEKEEDTLTVYTSWNNGEFWSRSTLEPEKKSEDDDTASSGSADMLKIALGLAGLFEETGPVTLTLPDGAEAEGIGFEGKIPAEMVQEFLRSLELPEELPFKLDEEDLTLVGELPVKLVLDKADSMIRRVELELSPVLGDLTEQTLQKVLEAYDLAGSGVSLAVNSIHTVTDLSDFDNVQVTVPEVPAD